MKEEQIINVARELFTTYGYKRVSMDEIAKCANVTKKTVYSYFKSKEELLKFFINEEIQNMKQVVEKTEDSSLPYLTNVHNVIYNLLEYKSNSKFIKSIVRENETFNNIIIMENLKQIDSEIKGYIFKKLQYAVEKKYIEIDDIEITAFLIYKMYIALMFEWPDKKINKEKISDNIIKILRNGLEGKNVKFEK